MRDAGMLRLALENRFEDRRPFELIGVGLVGGRRRHIERDRVEDLGFVVIGIFRGQRLHRLQIGLHARLVRGLVEVDIHHRQRVDVVALALRPGADRLRLLDRGKAGRKIWCRHRAVRVVEQRQRNAPIGDRALRICLERLLVDIPGFGVPERMLVSHGAVEPPLRHFVAGGREMNRAQLLIGGFFREQRAQSPSVATEAKVTANRVLRMTSSLCR